MKKKILSALLALFLCFTCLSCSKTSDDITPPISNEISNKLQILNSDLKLTQEQVMSQIKAEHLLENNGYVDTDEVIIMLTLKEEALIDVYNSKYSNYKSVSEYAVSSKGIKQNEKIKSEQDLMIEKLYDKNLIEDVEHRYSTIINAVAVKTTYGKLDKIADICGNDSIILSDTFNLPQSVTDTSAIENVVDVYETGIFNSSSVEYTGNRTAVAVLDSGFDCSHSVFANRPEEELFSMQYISTKLALTKANALNQTNAKNYGKELELSDVYYSPKIPFVYDYADKDPDPFPYDSEHGTHVAGIIGGHDSEITGVAINTQLVLMKVFPDLDDGAKTDDILAALEDAVWLGVDAINMSLGSSCGFAREKDGDRINEVYDKINESGISLITAASNSYSSGFGGEQGNTNKVTNPDSSTVGSPSTYEAALSVASISGTKSRYLVGNGTHVFFFKESNNISGKPNDFVNELKNAGHIVEGSKMTFDYITVPGVGLEGSYSSIDVKGKIALVRRGNNTFEEKAQIAKNFGAIACIIYNNVEGDINMSMGKSDHIPTVSISKEDGTRLASVNSGTITIDYSYQAGPFMSDFSSWGPTPSLGLKPEITAHGGNIKSAVPGGGYDELSGTSMATPNLCGIVVLIRQYLKQKYPDLSAKEISVLTNQLLMSTASIILNEEGNPYSPRKQGSGLASLKNATTTAAYITVDGIDRTKLELLDDPDRTGIYTMKFNVKNLSNETLIYNLSVIGMTESVSTADKDYVAETPYLLNGNMEVLSSSNASISGNVLTLDANETAVIELTYTLSQDDMKYIDASFPYGMYVEGFVKLEAETEIEGCIDLNIPFLAFYGDWTEAPMFDKTYFEIETEAHDASIDDEDKIKPDYYATTPYGSYYYNYIIPLGTYLYDIDTSIYDAIPAVEEHIALSNYLGSIDGIHSVYAGLLRNAKTINFTITDKITGEVVFSQENTNCQKAHSYGGAPVPNYEDLKFKSAQYNLINNRQYEFKMEGLLDYKDGGANSNIRNSFTFDFTLDDEAPILKDVSYEKIYDKTLKKDRYYITMTVYDNHYAQSITPLIFTVNDGYSIGTSVLSDNPIPIYSEKGQDNVVRFEITDYLDNIFADDLSSNCLAFSIDDYALNSKIYLCQLPGTKGDFKFTKDGTPEGSDLIILSMYENEVIDLTDYLSTTDETSDVDKSYLKHLTWVSSNDDVIEVKEGLVKCKKEGRATVTVSETINGKQAILIVNVKKQPTENEIESPSNVDNIEDSKIKNLRFSHFITEFAYSRAAQTSEIGETGDKIMLSSLGGISFYPGEKIQLFHDFDPWYAEDKYEMTYSSTNSNVASVDENGVVTGLKKGSSTIILRVNGSNLSARVRITIKSEFVIEDRILVAYKGIGDENGHVEIPDDEGILYIGAYAFCLYDTDNSIELTEDDYDANKIPSKNVLIKSVTIPEGVEEIQKFAFYNCASLETVNLPSSIRFVREYAFCKNLKLKTINLEDVETIGQEAFAECKELENVNIPNVYSIGVRAFRGCESLKSVDLTNLRNTGQEAFKDCSNLSTVTMCENTKLSYSMFINSGIEEIDIYEKNSIPEFCFAECKKLKRVTIHNDLVNIHEGAFSKCDELEIVDFKGSVEVIKDEVFYASPKLRNVILPNCTFSIGSYVFYECTELESLTFQANTNIENISGSLFAGSNLKKFIVDNANELYSANGAYLTNKNEDTIILYAVGDTTKDLIIDEKYLYIGNSAFSGLKVETVTINNKDTKIGDYAFANCDALVTVNLPENNNIIIGNSAFRNTEALVSITNINNVKSFGEYAFSKSKIKEIIIGDNVEVGIGAFFLSSIEKVTIGENTVLLGSAFERCLNLKEVIISGIGNVTISEWCFAYDAQLGLIDLSKTTDTIGKYAFYGCESITKADLTNVKVIEEGAFTDCAALNELNIPQVEYIGFGAFTLNEVYKGAPKFNEVIFPETLKTIDNQAFYGCEGLTKIVLPDSVDKIGKYAFAFCKNVNEIILSNNVKVIEEGTFAGCENLTTINVGHVKEFNLYAFTSSVLLNNVDLSSAIIIGDGAFADTSVGGNIVAENLKEIGIYAFQKPNEAKYINYYSSIESFTAPKLEKIGEGAFEYNRKFEEFTLSNKVKQIDFGVFHGCEEFVSFYFMDGSNKVNNGNINDYAKLDNGILYTKLDNGTYELNSVPANLDINTLEVLKDTTYVKFYAGNENKNITKIILPDSLKAIGAYAFYGLDSLTMVEFKSFSAPILEDFYNGEADLVEGDPGYELLHKFIDANGYLYDNTLYDYELCYFNFIDLAGKKEPIKMIVPSNEDIEGYDSLVYEAYFGKLENAYRSDYEAMNKNMILFVEYAKDISEINKITLMHEKLINDAITAYNSVKQDPTKFGYKQTEWNEMVNVVNNAKQTLFNIKLSNANMIVQNLQVKLNQLPTIFNVSMIDTLKQISKEIQDLPFEDRSLLDLTRYNSLVNSYNRYIASVEAEMQPTKNAVDNTFFNLNQTISTIITLSGSVLAIFRRKWFM